MAKKKTSKRKKSTGKKSGSPKAKVATENIKSFMKMNDEMETAIYGFAGELKINQSKEITPTQLLSQACRYLKSYAESNNISLQAIADKVSGVEGKDYSVTSADEIKEMKKKIAANKRLDRQVSSRMRTAKTARTKVRSAAGKKRSQPKK
jgi:hypothetical protein